MTVFASMSCDNKIERFTVLKLNFLNSKHPVSATIQAICFEGLNTCQLRYNHFRKTSFELFFQGNLGVHSPFYSFIFYL